MSQPWPLVPLAAVLTPVSRPEPVKSESAYSILGAHWYAAGLYTKEITTGAGIQATNLYRVEEGDFVYNRLFANHIEEIGDRLKSESRREPLAVSLRRSYRPTTARFSFLRLGRLHLGPEKTLGSLYQRYVEYYTAQTSQRAVTHRGGASDERRGLAGWVIEPLGDSPS